MEIPELSLTAVIRCEERNIALCMKFGTALPFDCVQEHGMVSGELTTAGFPLISTAPTPL